MTKIIVDSTADIKEEIADKFLRVPLSIHFGDKEYIDTVTINHKEFYTMLTTSDTVPTTSQPTPDSFLKMYADVAKNGDEAVVITVSSKFSGTFQSATIAAENYKGKVYVTDSASVAIGAGILAELALNMAKEGASAAEIAKKLETEKKKIAIVAMVDTLEYLKRGGRVSKTVAFAGGLLSIKPILSVVDGEINVIGKARGTKQGNTLLTQEIEKLGGIDFSKPFLTGYTGNSDELLQKYLADSVSLFEKGKDNISVAAIGSVIGTHAGPGAVAVAFFKR